MPASSFLASFVCYWLYSGAALSIHGIARISSGCSSVLGLCSSSSLASSSGKETTGLCHHACSRTGMFCLRCSSAFFFGAGFFPLVYYLSPRFLPPPPRESRFAQGGPSAILTCCPRSHLLPSHLWQHRCRGRLKAAPPLHLLRDNIRGIGGFVTLIGYYNSIVVPCMILFAVGSGLITTFGVRLFLRVWFGYQVVCGECTLSLRMPRVGSRS